MNLTSSTVQWRAQDVRLLIEMFEDGIAVAEIAERLGRTAGATRYKIARLREAGHHIERRRRTIQSGQDLRNISGIKVGSLSHALFAENVASRKAITWIADKISREGYASLAEFLVDLAIDQYFEEEDQKRAAEACDDALATSGRKKP